MKGLKLISGFNLKFKEWLSIPLLILVLFFVMAFASIKQQKKVVKNIFVEINSQDDIYFIDEQTVLKLATLEERDPLLGRNSSEVNLREIEQRIKINKFAHQVHAYKDIKGDLYINVKQSLPIARLISQNYQGYISDKGFLLPLSNQYTPRTLIVTGQGVDRLCVKEVYNDSIALSYFNLIKRIYEDTFLRTLFHMVDIQLNGEISLYPVIGKQVFLFGYPDAIDEKIQKIKIYFYKIAPSIGWNKYTYVNVKFNNQIIAE